MQVLESGDLGLPHQFIFCYLLCAIPKYTELLSLTTYSTLVKLPFCRSSYAWFLSTLTFSATSTFSNLLWLFYLKSCSVTITTIFCIIKFFHNIYSIYFLYKNYLIYCVCFYLFPISLTGI